MTSNVSRKSEDAPLPISSNSGLERDQTISEAGFGAARKSICSAEPGEPCC